MPPYSADLRVRVLAGCDAGMATANVAAKYSVSESWVRRLKQRRRETGSTAPIEHGRGPEPSWAAHAGRIAEAVRERPDDTLAVHRQRLGLPLSVSTLSRAMRALGLTVQKKVPRAAEQHRPDVAEARERWRAESAGWDAGRLVFLDETWASTNMARRYGRARRGERLVMAVPHGHWKTATFVAALRVGGLTAPTVVDGAINGELFEAYVRQQLVPTLRPGDVVAMANLAVHKRPGVRRAIEGAGCRLLLLPPYSPDLNPIELAFSRLKARLRRAGERTIAGLWRRLGQLLDEFSPEECRNFFKHCGYAATPTRQGDY